MVKPPNEAGHLNHLDGAMIRHELLKLHQADGDELIGYKVGFTGEAVQKSLGIDEPEFGYLTQSMNIHGKPKIPMLGNLQIFVEPELAFVMGEDLDGVDVSLERVLDATSEVVPAFEIVGSRVGLNAGISNILADNVGASRFVLSAERHSPVDFPFDSTLVGLKVDGECYSGHVNDVLSHPANSIAWLCRRLNELGSIGSTIKAGHIIMTGSPIKPVPVRAGTKVSAQWKGVGTHAVEFCQEGSE